MSRNLLMIVVVGVALGGAGCDGDEPVATRVVAGKAPAAAPEVWRPPPDLAPPAPAPPPAPEAATDADCGALTALTTVLWKRLAHDSKGAKAPRALVTAVDAAVARECRAREWPAQHVRCIATVAAAGTGDCDPSADPIVASVMRIMSAEMKAEVAREDRP